MKPLNGLIFFLIAALLLAWCGQAKALTNEDIAGVYQGTSTATLSNGATVSANVTITFKPAGNLKVMATVNGQTSTSKGKYQFVSSDAMLGTFTNSEFTAFVSLDESTLTFTILAKEADGSFVMEKTTAMLAKKL